MDEDTFKKSQGNYEEVWRIVHHEQNGTGCLVNVVKELFPDEVVEGVLRGRYERGKKAVERFWSKNIKVRG